VRTFVADNPDEVRKFKPLWRARALLLRVSFRSPGAVCDLSRKFGCDPEDAIALARLAASLGIDVQGFSFHVGSQAADALKHVEAIEACAAAAGARGASGSARSTRWISAAAFPIDYLQPALDIRASARRSARRWQGCRRGCG
jgi:ornithine decarboxylase